MRIGTLAFMYWRRVRAQPAQELLALAGIASGVALVFAVQVANNSVTGSVEQLSHGVTGRASIEVAARSSTGFNAHLLSQVKALPGVRAAAPVLERRVVITHAGRERGITLIGADRRVALLGGSLLKRFGESHSVYPGVALTQTTATRLGVDLSDDIRVNSGTNTTASKIGFVLTAADVGPLASSALALAPLERVQRMVGSPGKVSRILVEPRPGRDAAVKTELSQRFGNRLNVRPSGAEAHLLKQAAGPSDQATALFSAVSAIVGMLFAYCAMLLTVAGRRRDIAVLRLEGASDRKVFSGIAFDALVLGIAASFAGLVVGDQLSRHVFHALPGYLAFAFPTGEQRIVEPETILLALGGGILATLVAAVRPALELLSGEDLGARQRGGRAGGALKSMQAVGAWIGVVVIGVSTLVALLIPAASMIGVALVAVGMILVLPPLLRYALGAVDRLTYRLRTGGGLLAVSVSELRSNGTRTAALAATGAVAVFGIVGIQGARHDLLRGFDRYSQEFFGTGQAWVTSARDQNSLTTDAFDNRAVLRHLAHVPAITRSRAFFSDLLDTDEGRIWVHARSPNESNLVMRSEIVEGSAGVANRRLRSSGWAAVSSMLAKDRGVGIGERLTLQVPSGHRSFRVAALLTNLGWAPGGIVLNSKDFRSAWPNAQPSALELDFAPGAVGAKGVSDVRRALASMPGLRVETARDRATRISGDARAGLVRLGQIATLVLITAALAVAAAMGAAMWQRRPTLAMLKATGIDERRLWRALLLETGLVLAFGGLLGAGLGLLGQLMLTRWLELSTGYPAQFSPDVGLAATTIVTLSAIALAIAAIPGYFAARVSPAAQFQE